MKSTQAIFCVLLLSTLAINAYGQATCTDLGPVQYVAVVNTGPLIVITWQPPENSAGCDLKYDVKMTYDGEVIHQKTETIGVATISVEIKACVEGSISITPLDTELQIIGESYIHEVVADIGPVQDLSIEIDNEIYVATWIDPPNTERCDFKYNIEYSYDGGNNVSDVVDDMRFELTGVPTDPCVGIRLSVTPVYNTEQGKLITLDYETPSEAVNEFVVALNGEVIVSRWDPPENIDRCVLSYEVTQENKEQACFIQEISVTPLNKGIFPGIPVLREIETRMGPVLNLNIQLDSDQLSVSFLRPEKSTYCDLRYAVTINNDEESTTTTTNYIHSVDPIPCFVFNVIVTPISPTGQIGTPSRSKYEVGIGPVVGLQAIEQSGFIFVSWEAPKNSDLCSLRYLVEYTKQGENIMQIIDVPSYNFRATDVGNIQISVTPHTSRGIEGPKSTIIFERVALMDWVARLLRLEY